MVSSSDILLTFNAGSSSLKIGIFHAEGAGAHSAGRMKIDFDAASLTLEGSVEDTSVQERLEQCPVDDFGSLIDQVLHHLRHRLTRRIVAAGHRVVHGGMMFRQPAYVDTDTLEAIEALVPLAPLHQPSALRVIKALRMAEPEIPQFVSFDTAFHWSQEDVVRRMAIPRTMHDEGVQRYGFHGLSYASVSRTLRGIDPVAAAGRVVAAHLGSGASVCGMSDGKSRDASMGFSALDGIPMATRPGSLDVGALLYLMRQGMHQVEKIEEFLYHECGLLGVSGISGDTRILLKDRRPQAAEALELFCFRVAGEIARQASTLGGLDAVIFTAGVGENQPKLRRDIAIRLHWLGLELDEDQNSINATRISTSRSRVKIYVIPTDEEQMVADEALSVLLESGP